jgi:hypothetical protein
MLFTFQRLLLFTFFIIYLITIDARSIYEDTANQSVNGPVKDGDRNLVNTLANYRHRFERSMNFKKLRWAVGNLNSKALCDACVLLVPEVILFVL